MQMMKTLEKYLVISVIAVKAHLLVEQLAWLLRVQVQWQDEIK